MMGMSRNPHFPKFARERAREIRRLRSSGLSLSQREARFGVSRQ